jgi:hypothetical protein
VKPFQGLARVIADYRYFELDLRAIAQIPTRFLKLRVYQDSSSLRFIEIRHYLANCGDFQTWAFLMGFSDAYVSAKTAFVTTIEMTIGLLGPSLCGERRGWGQTRRESTAACKAQRGNEGRSTDQLGVSPK